MSPNVCKCIVKTKSCSGREIAKGEKASCQQSMCFSWTRTRRWIPSMEPVLVVYDKSCEVGGPTTFSSVNKLTRTCTLSMLQCTHSCIHADQWEHSTHTSSRMELVSRRPRQRGWWKVGAVFVCSAWMECSARDAERLLIRPRVALGSYIVRPTSGAHAGPLSRNGRFFYCFWTLHKSSLRLAPSLSISRRANGVRAFGAVRRARLGAAQRAPLHRARRRRRHLLARVADCRLN